MFPRLVPDRFFCLLALAATPGLLWAAIDPADSYAPRDTQPPGGPPMPTPAKAVAAIQLPAELKATLFAAEPDVRQPIDMKIDDQGRVWVCEAYSYKEWQRKGEDRVVILTDTDGDGAADKRQVFLSGLHQLSSVALGYGGAWVLDSPNLYFVPDADADGVPDGPPQVVLDGWTTEGQHNIPSGLTWGPDGWLYGRHGIVHNSLVGRPGAAAAARLEIGPGIWRMHPVTKKCEAIVRGMTNPWGLDWNADGEMFISGNVNGHLWHGIPGALYERMYGAGLVPNDYERLLMIGERPHYAGTGDWKADWNVAEKGRDAANDLGGGHSHVGLLVYQGDAWPQRYRGHLFMNNTHGRRVNDEIVEPRGASYVGKHTGDVITFNNPWFRGVGLESGPDGNVYISDWCDHGECHDDDGVDRSSGRIYKISARTHAAGTPPAPAYNIAAETDLALASLQTHANEWHVRHARRLLQERAATRPLAPEAVARLREILAQKENTTHQLRALWTLHGAGLLTAEERLRFTESPVIAHRVWGVRLIAEQETLSDAEKSRLLAMADNGEASLRVRLELASIMARLPRDFALMLGWPLAIHPASDPTLELVLWHVLEPLVVPDADGEASMWASVQSVAIASATPFPKLRQFITRRLGVAIDEEGLRVAFGQLLDAASRENPETDDKPFFIRDDIFDGAMAALQGRSNRPAPPQWPAIAQKLLASPSPKARATAVALSVAFNDTATLDALRAQFHDAASAEAKIEALAALRQAQVADLPALLLAALNDPPLRLAALRSLASSTDPQPAQRALELWPELSTEEKTAAVDALAARADSARRLLEAVAAGRVARTDIGIAQARLLAALNDAEVSRLLTAHWGDLKAASADKEALIARYHATFGAPSEKPDLAHGRDVFRAACGTCHVLFGEGGKLGPDLTGGGRKDLDYILRNVLDPSAVVPNDYRMIVVTLKNGEVLAGVIPTQDATTLTVQTMTERRVLERSALASVQGQPFSWMPEGLLQALPEKDVRDLLAYLRGDGPP